MDLGKWIPRIVGTSNREIFGQPRVRGQLDVGNGWERGIRVTNLVSMVKSYQSIDVLSVAECQEQLISFPGDTTEHSFCCILLDRGAKNSSG